MANMFGCLVGRVSDDSFKWIMELNALAVDGNCFDVLLGLLEQLTAAYISVLVLGIDLNHLVQHHQQ